MLEVEKFDQENLVGRLHYPFNRNCVVEAFEHLVKELGPVIHKYNTIVGDDVSGRLPTLVIAELTRKKRIQLGLLPPQVFFLNAGSNIKNSTSINGLPKVRDLIEKYADENRKILIVTEYVCTGDSISILANEFKKINLKPDLCILESSHDPIMIGSLADYKRFLGAVSGGAGGQFYFNQTFTGLNGFDGSPIATRKSPDNFSIEKVTQARQDMKLIANEMWKLIE
jgi:hypothetical protein